MTRKAPATQRGGRSAAVQSQQQTTPPLKRGPWTAEEDELLARFVKREGEGRWRTLPRRAGLLRCGKSCRLRWMNYLRPDIKRGPIDDDEEDLILRLHRILGNRWSLIAGRLPGRTDNEIKNYWNSHLSKKLIAQGIDPRTHTPLAAAAADKTAPPLVQAPPPLPPPPPPPVQPTSSAAATRGDGGLASPVGGDDDFAAAMTMSLDAQGFEGLGDQFCARGGFDHDMGFAMVDADDAFTSFLDSLIDDRQFADYLVEGDSDHRTAISEKDQGGAT